MVCEENGRTGLLDGSFIRSISEFIVDEDTCVERRRPFEASAVEFVGERRRHGGKVMGKRASAWNPLYMVRSEDLLTPIGHQVSRAHCGENPPLGRLF